MKSAKSPSIIPQHNSSFDILRIISAFSVVVLHVSASYIMSNEISSIDFKIANFINSISRFGVPIFVMISGSIFLSEGKNITIRRIWSHNIFRLFSIYIIWSFSYYVFQSLYFWNFDFWNHGLIRTLTGCIYASEHFWFIFMIIGLYALTPILRSWLSSPSAKDLIPYLNILFILFQLIRTTLTILIDKSLVYKISDMLKITELTGYLGYYIMGYYLSHCGLSSKLKKWVYGLVPIGIIINYSVSNYMSAKAGTYSAGIYDSFGVFTFINVIALFIFITDITSKIQFKKGALTILQNIALDTLGIYLMHVALLEYLINEKIIFNQISVFPGIILLSSLCFGICCIVSAIIRRIPYIGHYLC